MKYKITFKDGKTRIIDSRSLKNQVKDSILKSGSNFTSKSGYEITIKSIDRIEFSEYDGHCDVLFSYSWKSPDGKSGTSKANNYDLFNMLKK